MAASAELTSEQKKLEEAKKRKLELRGMINKCKSFDQYTKFMEEMSIVSLRIEAIQSRLDGEWSIRKKRPISIEAQVM